MKVLTLNPPAIRHPQPALVTQSQAASNYQRIEKAIRYLDTHLNRQPSLAELADHVALSPDHLQRLFTDWAGISPKRFLQSLTATALKQRLNQFPTLADAADAVGLDSPQRVYDLFITLEAVSPQVFRQQGAGLTIQYGLHDSPFGQCLIATSERGITDLHFVSPGDEPFYLRELQNRWANAQLLEDHAATAPLIAQAFDKLRLTNGQANSTPLRLWVAGTQFQIKVWEALLRIPPGKLTSYGSLAANLGQPKAAQAVGGAVGSNPVGWLIPCHRVIRTTGVISDYRWGSPRKQAILAWEAAQAA